MVEKGKLFLSCGHEHTEDMPDVDKLIFSYKTEDCDAIQGFIPVEITGVYCPKCLKYMQKYYNELALDQS